MFNGVIPILATPFHDDERVDLESWQRLIEFMTRLEVNGITILGVLGESNRLSDRERETLIGAAVSIGRRSRAGDRRQQPHGHPGGTRSSTGWPRISAQTL